MTKDFTDIKISNLEQELRVIERLRSTAEQLNRDLETRLNNATESNRTLESSLRKLHAQKTEWCNLPRWKQVLQILSAGK